MDNNLFNLDVEQALKILVKPKDFMMFDVGVLYSQKYIADVIAGRKFNEIIWDRMQYIATEKLKALNNAWRIEE